MEHPRIVTPEKHSPPLYRRVLIFAQEFYMNMRALLKSGEMHNLEGFIGGFCLVWGLSRFIPVIWEWGELREDRFQRAIPNFVWASFLTVLGTVTINGAVMNHLPSRVWSCRIGMMLWIGILTLNVLSGLWIAERMGICIYFTASFSWLYARILREASLTTRRQEGSGADRTEGFDHPPDGAGGQRSHHEIHRVSASRS